MLKIRAVKVVLTLEKSTYSNGLNTKTIYSASLPDYLHTEVMIQRTANFQGNTAVISIYGMLLDDVFDATKFNPSEVLLYNTVSVYAGYINPRANEDGSYNQGDVEIECDKLPLIWLGSVLCAYPDFNDVNRPFIIQSNVNVSALSTNIQALDINTQVTLSTAVKTIVNNYNDTQPNILWKLINVIPDCQVNNAHYTGDARTQLTQLLESYNYQVRFVPEDDNAQGLYISQVGINYADNPSDLSSDTGMIGYPTVLPFGITVKEYFNEERSINDVINLQTYFKPLEGKYYVWQESILLQTNGDEWSDTLMLLAIPVSQ